MTVQSVQIKIGQSLGEGRYSSSIVGGGQPSIAGLATLQTDITTALGNAGIAFDSTSDITTIQTDATALALGGLGGDVNVSWDDTKITHRVQLTRALEKAMEAVRAGYGGLAE